MVVVIVRRYSNSNSIILMNTALRRLSLCQCPAPEGGMLISFLEPDAEWRVGYHVLSLGRHPHIINQSEGFIEIN